jgi:glycosyltransferase involved in cell wall biosynthesis
MFHAQGCAPDGGSQRGLEDAVAGLFYASRRDDSFSIMNILVICPDIPFPLTDGRSLILYNVFKRLSARHTVYLLAFESPRLDERAETVLRGIFAEIHAMGSERRSRSAFRYVRNAFSWNSGFMMKDRYPARYRECIARIAELVRSKKIDVVHFAAINSAEFVHAAEGCGTVLHLVDSMTLEMRRALGAWRSPLRYLRKIRRVLWYLRFSWYEKRVMNLFDASITVGAKDYEVLTSLAPDANVVLIPNGVDAEYFSVAPNRDSPRPTVLFTGNMSFPPNIDAVTYFHDEVFPLIRKHVANARFVIAGTSPPGRIRRLSDGESVVVTGYVDDIRTVMAEADVIVVPMRIGGGIKNKILESMAFGKPVVATSVGAEGVNARNGESILIADAPVEIANAVMRLLRDPALCDRIAAEARKLIEEKYTWNTAAERYEAVFENVLRRRRHSQ